MRAIDTRTGSRSHEIVLKKIIRDTTLFAGGALALLGATNNATAAEAHSAFVPSGDYYCPDEVMNPQYAPRREQTIFSRWRGIDDIADLVVVRDTEGVDLWGSSRVEPNKCTIETFDQFQVASIANGDAVNPTFTWTAVNGRGIHIDGVGMYSPGLYDVQAEFVADTPVPDYRISPDGNSVTVKLEDRMPYGEQRVVRVHYTPTAPVEKQEFAVSVSSDTADKVPEDNSIVYDEAIYPEKVQLSSTLDYPHIRNLRISRAAGRCIVRPIRFSGGEHAFFHGRIAIALQKSSTKDFKHPTTTRLKTRYFDTLDHSQTVDVPVKVCRIPSQKYVRLAATVFAANMSEHRSMRLESSYSSQRKAFVRPHPVF